MSIIAAWISVKNNRAIQSRITVTFFDAQISRYENSGNEFWFFICHGRSFKDCLRSISVGILIPQEEIQIHR
jgi:hypothetical protein